MKLQKTPGLVTMGIVGVVVVVMWIGFEVYRGLTREPDISVPAPILRELNPTLDQEALNQLQQRIHLSDTQIGEGTKLVVSQLEQETQELTLEPSPTPEASPSGSTQTGQPEATESAGVTPSL